MRVAIRLAVVIVVVIAGFGSSGLQDRRQAAWDSICKGIGTRLAEKKSLDDAIRGAIQDARSSSLEDLAQFAGKLGTNPRLDIGSVATLAGEDWKIDVSCPHVPLADLLVGLDPIMLGGPSLLGIRDRPIGPSGFDYRAERATIVAELRKNPTDANFEIAKGKVAKLVEKLDAERGAACRLLGGKPGMDELMNEFTCAELPTEKVSWKAVDRSPFVECHRTKGSWEESTNCNGACRLNGAPCPYRGDRTGECDCGEGRCVLVQGKQQTCIKTPKWQGKWL